MTPFEIVEIIRQRVKESKPKNDFLRSLPVLTEEQKAAAFFTLANELYEQEDRRSRDIVRASGEKMESLARERGRLAEELNIKKLVAEQLHAENIELKQKLKVLKAAKCKPAFQPIGFIVKSGGGKRHETRHATESEARKAVIDHLASDSRSSVQVMAILYEAELSWSSSAPQPQKPAKRTRKQVQMASKFGESVPDEVSA